MQTKALVVIDIQDDITKHYRDIVDNINAAIEWAVSEDMLRATPLHQTSRWAIENVAMLSISVMGSVWDKSQA